MKYPRWTYGLCLLGLIGCGKPEHQYQGYVEAENLYLSSPYGGRLLSLNVVRGQFIEKGEPLFDLDSNPEAYSLQEQEALHSQSLATLKDLQKPRRKQEIEAIEAQLKQVESQLSLASIRLKRNQTLYEKHVMDKDTLDAASERYNEVSALKTQTLANLELARLGSRKDRITAQKAAAFSVQSHVDLLKWEIQQKHLSAPTAGVVFDTYYRPGEYVAGDHPVLSIVAPENTYIEFFVPLDELKNIHLGKEIYFSYETQTEKQRAKIIYVSPEAEYMPPLVYSRSNSDKIVFRIKANILSHGRLIPGEPVIVSIGTSHDS